jgi:hypothetical protein
VAGHLHLRASPRAAYAPSGGHGDRKGVGRIEPRMDIDGHR